MSNIPTDLFPMEGGCACGTIRYRLEKAPIYIHCCHCTWCQRETGASFALNAMIEASNVTLLSPETLSPIKVSIPTINGGVGSGKEQVIWRCPRCMIMLWSNYASPGHNVHIVRVGTLDQARSLRPNMHIWTESKQPWVVLDDVIPAVEGDYDKETSENWSEEQLERLRKAKESP